MVEALVVMSDSVGNGIWFAVTASCTALLLSVETLMKLLLEVIDPSPNWPYKFQPVAHKLSSSVRIMVWPNPAATAFTPLDFTSIKLVLSVVDPSPS